MKKISEIFNQNNQLVKRSVVLGLGSANLFLFTRLENFEYELEAPFYALLLINALFVGFCAYKFFNPDSRGYVYMLFGVVLFFVNAFYLSTLQYPLHSIKLEGVWRSEDGSNLKIEFESDSVCYFSLEPDLDAVEYRYFLKADSLYMLSAEGNEAKIAFKAVAKSANSIVLERGEKAALIRKVLK